MASQLSIADLIRRGNAGEFDPRHPTTDLAIGTFTVAVDIEIAPLIKKIWTAGVVTIASCQGDDMGNEAYICFPRQKDLRVFLQRCPVATDLASRVDWITEGNLEIMTCADAEKQEEHRATISYSIRFAHGDLKIITDGFC